MASGASALSHRMTVFFGVTSMNPPLVAKSSSPDSRRMRISPGLSEQRSGAWLARTPRYPFSAGATRDTTSSEKTSFSGVTISSRKVLAILLPLSENHRERRHDEEGDGDQQDHHQPPEGALSNDQDEHPDQRGHRQQRGCQAARGRFHDPPFLRSRMIATAPLPSRNRVVTTQTNVATAGHSFRWAANACPLKMPTAVMNNPD